MILQSKSKSRRGIVILIVLSLLVLFIVLAVTFAIVAGQYRRAAEAQGKQELLGTLPTKDLDSALYQLVRGTRTKGSALRYQELLRDKYGVDGFHGYIDTATLVTQSGDQLMDIKMKRVPTPPAPAAPDDWWYQWKTVTQIGPWGTTTVSPTWVTPDYRLSAVEQFYAGCEFSVVSGPAAGATARIVGYSPPDPATSTKATLRVAILKTPHGLAVTKTELENANNSNDPYRFIVNGLPFNGTGAGYQAATGNNPSLDDAEDLGYTGKTPLYPSAILPNYAITAPVETGGLDESYDAPDYQNMFMGLVLPAAKGCQDIQPSFHRRELVDYWHKKDLTKIVADPQFLARIVLRPLPVPGSPGLNKNFTGSNSDARFQLDPNIANTSDPNYQKFVDDLLWALSFKDPTNASGPQPRWDVDNDGDGIPDSIWLDLGLPIQTTSDGRQYKPLFAILCTDLDGRLNVNAHDRAAGVLATNKPTPLTTLAGGVSTDTLPRGQGYGPPEIALGGVFGNSLSNLMDLRYGSNGAGNAAIDTMTQIRFLGHPNNYGSGTGMVFRSPPDVQGELRMGLSLDGQPQFETSFLGVNNVPYQFDLSADRSGGDAAFTPAELERLLRPSDIDATQLPSRLAALVNLLTTTSDLNGDGNVDNADQDIWRTLVRRSVTTDSFDLPCPNLAPLGEVGRLLRKQKGDDQLLNPKDQYLPGNMANNILALLRARMVKTNGWPLPLTAAQEKAISYQTYKMLSPDLLLGLRMDVNRPFGNGIDDNGNSVNDDPREATNEKVWSLITHATYNNLNFEHLNGANFGKLDGNAGIYATATDVQWARQFARQLYARHLYVLALTLIDWDSGGTGVPDPALAREVAQWAVNVVDFRDVDSIMTPFEYDPNPFDGWQVDGWVTGHLWDPVNDKPATRVSTDDKQNKDGEKNVVWGCERPELLITKTLAFHARRTEDSDLDAETKKKAADEPADGITEFKDFDQRLRPYGTLFIELYNPWTGNDSTTTPPTELYTDNNNTLKDGVVLNKTTPNGYPVWRILVLNKADPDFKRDPDKWEETSGIDKIGSDAERGIYFLDPTTKLAAANTHGKRRFYSGINATTTPLVVKRGGFAVLGPPGIKALADPLTADGVSTIGRHKLAMDSDQGGTGADPLLIADTHRVFLDRTNNEVTVYKDATTFQKKTATVVWIDKSDCTLAGKLPMALNVSEPLDGYDLSPSWLATAASGEGGLYDAGKKEGAYVDLPWDAIKPIQYPDVSATDGTVRDFCVIHLQRLADPTRDWHPTGNPYRTIDSSSVDLTVFNGVDSFGSEGAYGVAQVEVDVGLERGEGDVKPDTSTKKGKRLWPQVLTRSFVKAKQDIPNHFFDYSIETNLASANTTYLDTNGQPSTLPFPWLNWNDRPFVSQYELMQVPGRSSYNLLRDYNFNATFPPYDSPYDNDAVKNPFSHLPNLFWATDDSNGNKARHAYRLFEYLHVPSRFNGTEPLLNPTKFASVGYELPTAAQPLAPSCFPPAFYPPFNRISNYRDPGRVNVNTIVDQRVWDAIRGSFGGPTFDELVKSRRGDGAAGILDLDPTKPTFFGNAFRAPGSGSLVPLKTLQYNDVETTLLRSKNAAGNDQAPTSDALFQFPNPNDTASMKDCNDPRRNSYFRYQTLTRLGNLLTTHSNVYAVWITVGYFEVDSSGLGLEVGSDTGEVKRHRSFYIIDRSIPVAFEPGENHNVDRCILLRREIE